VQPAQGVLEGDPGLGGQLAGQRADAVVGVLDQDESVNRAAAAELGVRRARVQTAHQAADPDPARKRGVELIFDGTEHIADLEQATLTIQSGATLSHRAENTDSWAGRAGRRAICLPVSCVDLR
jgi:hypothetical protein